MKNKKKEYVLKSQHDRIVREMSKVASVKALLVFIITAYDELKLTDEQLQSLVERSEKYIGLVLQGAVSIEEMEDIIYKHTGLVFGDSKFIPKEVRDRLGK